MDDIDISMAAVVHAVLSATVTPQRAGGMYVNSAFQLQLSLAAAGGFRGVSICP